MAGADPALDSGPGNKALRHSARLGRKIDRALSSTSSSTLSEHARQHLDKGLDEVPDKVCCPEGYHFADEFGYQCPGRVEGKLR